MTDAKVLGELAERCEKATAEQQASLLIEAFDLTNWRSRHRLGGAVHHNPEWMAFDRLIRASGFLDAAMTLAPEGWHTSDFHQGPSGGNWWKLSTIRGTDTYYTSVAGKAGSPALALTAAALRARATWAAFQRKT